MTAHLHPFSPTSLKICPPNDILCPPLGNLFLTSQIMSSLSLRWTSNCLKTPSKKRARHLQPKTLWVFRYRDPRDFLFSVSDMLQIHSSRLGLETRNQLLQIISMPPVSNLPGHI